MSLARAIVTVSLYLSYALLAAAFVVLFFSPFGPFDDHLIPYHPIGWAGIFMYFAMLLSFKQKFEETKDLFWFIVALGFFPLFISDLYFFPLPRLLGFGMLEWAGAQFVVFFVSFVLFSRVKVLKYINLVMLILLPVAIVAWFSPDQIALLNAFRSVPLLFLFVTTLSLSYYSLKQRDYLFVFGTVLNFMIANVISTLYATTGSLAFGWSQPFMAVVTDRMAIFGRILMTLNLSSRIKRGQKRATTGRQRRSQRNLFSRPYCNNKNPSSVSLAMSKE